MAMEERQRRTLMMAAEKFVEIAMAGRDASHDAAHAFRVRDLALSLAMEEGLESHNMEVVELAALLHDIGDYKYNKDFVEDTLIVENFLGEEGVEESKRKKILDIIKKMGFKNELQKNFIDSSLEFGVVQDADRLDAIGAIGEYHELFQITCSCRRNSFVLELLDVLLMVEALTRYCMILRYPLDKIYQKKSI